MGFKEGVGAHMILLHFVYMLVMNKKLATFIKQSDESFKQVSDCHGDGHKSNQEWGASLLQHLKVV
jgi:hypothetical protein